MRVHGETKTETLGSGDGTKARQQFTLHASPLTHLPASTRKGSQSTLQVFVDGVQWKEVETLATAGPSDRCYISRTDDSDVTTITFRDVAGAEEAKADLMEEVDFLRHPQKYHAIGARIPRSAGRFRSDSSRRDPAPSLSRWERSRRVGMA